MTPGDRLDLNKHMTASFTVSCIACGVLTITTGWLPFAYSTLATALCTAGFMLDHWRTDRAIKRRVHEDLNRKYSTMAPAGDTAISGTTSEQPEKSIYPSASETGDHGSVTRGGTS